MSVSVLLKETRSSLLKLLDEAQVCLATFLKKELPKLQKNWWAPYVVRKLSELQIADLKNEDLDSLDFSALLSVLIGNWRDISKSRRGYALAHQMLNEIRNDFQAHFTTEKIKNLSAEDLYRHLDTLQRFLNVIKGADDLIEQVRESKLSIVPLLLGKELPLDPHPVDLTSGFESGQGETGDKGEVRAAPTAEVIRNPVSPKATVNQGVATHNVVQPQPVIGGHGRAIHPTSDDAKVYYNRGLAKLTPEQYEAAIKDCDAAVDQTPNSADAYNDRGIVKLSHEQYEAALEDFNQALRLDTDYVPAYTNRSYAKARLKQHAGAIEDCNKALDLNPNHAPAYIRRGDAKRNLKQYESAIEDYNQALSINPDNVHAYNLR
jgi:tetratricopeptide (TPR) repeat protein